LFWVKNVNFYAKVFGENILKIITSVHSFFNYFSLICWLNGTTANCRAKKCRAKNCRAKNCCFLKSEKLSREKLSPAKLSPRKIAAAKNCRRLYNFFCNLSTIFSTIFLQFFLQFSYNFFRQFLAILPTNTAGFLHILGLFDLT
jgi:hypothetical protein